MMGMRRFGLRFIEEPITGEPSGGGTPDAEETQPGEPAEDQVVPGEDALGDPGKKALDAMKAKWKAAEAAAKEREAALAELQAKIDGREAEHKAEQERREVESAALAKANDRIKRAEVRAAAAGKLADPSDALRFIDLDGIEVSDDGEVDSSAIMEAIEGLIVSKPYLAAAQGGQRFQGTADQGARNVTPKSEVESLTEALAKARAAGNTIASIELQTRLAGLVSKSK